MPVGPKVFTMRMVSVVRMVLVLPKMFMLPELTTVIKLHTKIMVAMVPVLPKVGTTLMVSMMLMC